MEFSRDAFVTRLLNLCQQRQRVIIVSGDIHYSCVVRIVHWDYQTQSTSVIIQLTSSVIKNSELATRLIHTRLKSLLTEATERWLGWNHSRQQTKLPRYRWWRKQPHKLKHADADWQYRIEWIKRQPSQTLPWRNHWLQEETEVVGRNNISLVKFNWSQTTMIIQETHWHPLGARAQR
ncbi:MAG: hypothetical protein AAFQ41_02785 [Cyanobacteria bacterium J06623_7]